jgi:hypothetical protein
MVPYCLCALTASRGVQLSLVYARISTALSLGVLWSVN